MDKSLPKQHLSMQYPKACVVADVQANALKLNTEILIEGGPKNYIHISLQAAATQFTCQILKAESLVGKP